MVEKRNSYELVVENYWAHSRHQESQFMAFGGFYLALSGVLVALVFGKEVQEIGASGQTAALLALGILGLATCLLSAGWAYVSRWFRYAAEEIETRHLGVDPTLTRQGYLAPIRQGDPPSETERKDKPYENWDVLLGLVWVSALVLGQMAVASCTLRAGNGWVLYVGGSVGWGVAAYLVGLLAFTTAGRAIDLKTKGGETLVADASGRPGTRGPSERP